MVQQFKALIFDCDGTIADTMPLHFITWQQVTEKYGLQLSEKQFYAWAGVPTRKIILWLAEEAGKEIDIDAASRDKDQFYHDALPGIKPIQPILDIIEQNYGILPMAVASGSLRSSVEKTLTQLNLLHCFDALITAEDVTHPKPAPDIFLKAAQQLNKLPQDCCAYEDSNLGLQAIRDAGMTAVDIRKMI